MPKPLKLYLTGVVALGAVALVAATLSSAPLNSIAIRWVTQPPQSPNDLELLAGIAFWTGAVLLTSALPVQMPRGTKLSVSTAPILAAIILGGPAVGGWVAAIGTTELRELRGRIPWYGSLANHAGLVIPAVLAGTLREGLLLIWGGAVAEFVTAMIAAAVFMSTNLLLASLLLGLRT